MMIPFVSLQLTMTIHNMYILCMYVCLYVHFIF